MSDDNVIDLAAHRTDAMQAAHERGELFKFACLHADDFNPGTSDGAVILHRKDGLDGFQMTPEDAERIGMELIGCAAIARLEASGRMTYTGTDGET